MTNKVIRENENDENSFVRVRFSNEKQECDFYFADNKKYLLGHIHAVMTYGFSLPSKKRMLFRFVSYSSS